jgi:hypothetical protein
MAFYVAFAPQAVQGLLRSLVEPPDTLIRQNSRANVQTFIESVSAQDIVQYTLNLRNIYESRVAQIQQDRRKKQPRSQIQKGGIVYAADVDRNISCFLELIASWETNITRDQIAYLLCLRSLVLPQLILRTKSREEVADRGAKNCARRVSRWLKKALKREEDTELIVDLSDID